MPATFFLSVNMIVAVLFHLYLPEESPSSGMARCFKRDRISFRLYSIDDFRPWKVQDKPELTVLP